MSLTDLFRAGWISYATAAVLSAGITLVALPEQPYWSTVAVATILFGSMIWASIPLILYLAGPDDR